MRRPTSSKLIILMGIQKWPRLNWSTPTIGELIEASEAEIKTGPSGTQLYTRGYVDSGISVIHAKNLGMGVMLYSDLKFIDDETFERLLVHSLQKGDIIPSRRGAIDQHGYVSDECTYSIQGPGLWEVGLYLPTK